MYKVILIVVSLIESIILWLFKFIWFENFFFGTCLCIFIAVINLSCLAIYIYIKDVQTEKDNKGMTIYFLCCIKFGQKGKYNKA